MKLFSDAKSRSDDQAAQRQKKSASQQLVIISPRRDVLSEIASVLLMHNFKNVVKHEGDFFSLQDDSITRDAIAVIVDIADSHDVELITDTAILLIPAGVRPIFIGNNDSIVFAQALMRTGASYLHFGSQLPQLAALVQVQDSLPINRTTMKISVLGCKGGAGATTVSYHLFQSIGMLTSLPSLLVQGGSGSNDLDLLMARALPKEGSIAAVSANQSVRIEALDGMWNYEDTQFNHYNLVIFDHPIHAQPTERLETVIAQSHTIVLVITRDLSTLRMAKNILDEYKRIMLTRPARELRIVVCLNEIHPVHADELRNDDIEEYLGCRILCVNPYKIKNSNTSVDSALYRFAAYLLGKPLAALPRKKIVNLTSLFRRQA